jgi:ABC-type bacteriocin/lantibiotic exporter with double-glycine peptidase domain
MLYVYHNTYGNKDSHTDRSKIIHLNNQLINFNSFNWALLDLLIHLYTIFFYIFLIVYAYQNYLVNILAAIFLISILIVPVIKVASKAGSIFISTQGRLIKSISRIIDGIETIITFGSIDSITRKVKEDNKIVIKNGLFLSGSVSLSSLFPEFIIVILICLMLLVYTVPVEGIATLATFSIIGLRMLQTINQISSCLGRAEASKEAYLEIINFFQSKAINHSHSNLGKRDFKESFYKLELRNIEVVIGKNKILSDVSYNFQQKRKYIISGANGSGKSTLIKTLVGLVDAQGNFLINDQDISSYSAASLQKLITFHNQDNFLFEGTVLENISFFSSVDISKVQEVFAELTIEPSKVFSNGLNTTIKENGIGMSGGQKQLICLARSLTTNAQILVLDEPTNHLSKENAKKIMSYLLRLDKTVIIVSHEIFSEEVKNISYLNTGKIQVSEINN